MIPVSNLILKEDFEITSQPTKTYKMDFQNLTVRGYTDGLDAMKQAVYHMINTERFQFIMYSNNYGIETIDLFGEPVSFVCSELERRIKEALLCDDRIESVTDFEFDIKKGSVGVSFCVNTIWGTVTAEREVNF